MTQRSAISRHPAATCDSLSLKANSFKLLLQPTPSISPLRGPVNRGSFASRQLSAVSSLRNA